MFDIRRIAKQVFAALSATFGGTWAAIASLAGALKVDVAAGKQAAFAAVAAGIAAALAWGGSLLKQLIAKARGVLAVGADEAIALLAEAEAKIAAARDSLAG